MDTSPFAMLPATRSASTRDGLLDADHVLPHLVRWHRQGQRAALVTLVAIEGPGPRPLGAQMAVSEDGRYVGYLSGGCLEGAVALEAQAVIRAGQNRLVRFGRGSKYFDIVLPCGSGLDLYFDQTIPLATLDAMSRLATARRPFALRTRLDDGSSRIIERPAGASVDFEHATGRDDTVFTRAYLPTPKLLLIGAGPAVVAIARLASLTGLTLDILTPDDHARHALSGHGLEAAGLITATLPPHASPDPWSAVVIAFHEHDREPPLLAEVLRSPAFYIGALGNRRVHADRLSNLSAQGFTAQDLARIRPSLGLIAGAKSQATLAAGVLADILAEAKSRGYVD